MSKNYGNENFSCELEENPVKVNFDWTGPDYEVGQDQGELTICQVLNSNNQDILDSLSKEAIHLLEEQADQFLADKFDEMEINTNERFKKYYEFLQSMIDPAD